MTQARRGLQIDIPRILDEDYGKELSSPSPRAVLKVQSRLSTKETINDSNSDHPKAGQPPDTVTLKKSFNASKAEGQPGFPAPNYDMFASQKVVKPVQRSRSISQTPKGSQGSKLRTSESQPPNLFENRPDLPNVVGALKLFKIRDNFLTFCNRPSHLPKVLCFGTQIPFLKVWQPVCSIATDTRRKDTCLGGSHLPAADVKPFKRSLPKQPIGIPSNRKGAESNENVELSFCGNSQLMESLARFKDSEFFRAAPFASNSSESADYNSVYFSDNIRSLNSFLERNASRGVRPQAPVLPAPNEEASDEMSRFFEGLNGKSEGGANLDKYFSSQSSAKDAAEIVSERQPGMFANLIGGRPGAGEGPKVFRNELFNLGVPQAAQRFHFEKKGAPEAPFESAGKDIQAFGTHCSDDYKEFMESDKDLQYASFNYLEPGKGGRSRRFESNRLEK